MYLVWITNLSMNIIQTSQIKSNKMMVEKLLEKSKEKKIWRKTNIMFLSNVFWHFVLLFHSRKPAQYNNDFRILSFRSFYLLCSIRWPLSVINWMLSIKNELPFYNSLFFLYRFTMQFRESRNNRSSNENNKNIWIVSIRSLNK